MIDWTKPIQHRDGRKARVLATDVNNNSYPIVVALQYRKDSPEEVICTYTKDGYNHKGDKGTKTPDIINEPEKITQWAIVCKDGYNRVYITSLHNELYKARQEYRDNSCFGIAKIVIKEGEIQE